MSSFKVHFESIEFKISILFDKFQHIRSQNIYIQDITFKKIKIFFEIPVIIYNFKLEKNTCKI